jgi:hypothetical protein
LWSNQETSSTCRRPHSTLPDDSRTMQAHLSSSLLPSMSSSRRRRQTRSRGFVATPKTAMYVKSSWTRDDFAAAGFRVDDCVAIGSRRELESLAKYGITGLGEVKLVLGMLLERDRPAHDINIAAGGIHGLYPSLIQPHRRDHSLDAPRTWNSAADCPTSKDEIPEMSTRPHLSTRVAKHRVGNMCAASSRDHA